MFEEAFCVLCMRNELFRIFDWLYLLTDVSYGDRKGVIFRSFAGSFMWHEQVCSGRMFYFDDFYFIGKPWGKIQKPHGATSMLPMFVGTISKCVICRGRYQHTKFRTSIKNSTILPFAAPLHTGQG